MKKVFFITCLAAFFLLSVSSCKKCMTCEIKYNSVSGEKTKVSQECGGKNDLEDFEAAQKALADTLDGTVVCNTEE